MAYRTRFCCDGERSDDYASHHTEFVTVLGYEVDEVECPTCGEYMEWDEDLERSREDVFGSN